MPAKLAGSGGNTILKRQKFKKAIVTIEGEFKWPEEPEGKTFGIQDAVQERSRFMNRLKGWRMRPHHGLQEAKKAADALAAAEKAAETKA